MLLLATPESLGQAFRDRELLELAKREAAAFVANGGAEATPAERAVVAGRLKKAWQRRYGLVEAG